MPPIQKKFKKIVKKSMKPKVKFDDIPWEELEVGQEIDVVFKPTVRDAEEMTCPGMVTAKDEDGSVTIKLLDHRDPENASQN